MSKFKKILKPEESILWMSSKKVNFVLIYPAYIMLFAFTLIIFLPLLYLGFFIFNKNSLSTGQILMIASILLELSVIISMIYIFRKTHKYYRITLKTTNEELKKYEVIYIISNHRILIKNIREIKNLKKYIEYNSITDIKFDKDVFFIDLEKIKVIVQENYYHQIRFLIDKNMKRPLIFDFQYRKNKKEKINEAMDILNKNFLLEKCFEDNCVIKYNFNQKY